MTLPDPLKALCAFLRAQPTLVNLLTPIPGGLSNLPAGAPPIFRPDLPKEFQSVMPTACIVCRPAGGFKTYGDQRFFVADPTIDFTILGTTMTQALEVSQALAEILMQSFTNTNGQPVSQVWEDCMLYSTQVTAGPVPLPDTQTLWPAVWLSCKLVHGQLPA